MSVQKCYSRINWLNKSESMTTPLGKTNLNKMDKAIETIDNEVVSIASTVESIDTTKADADQLNNMVTDISFNDKNGVITIIKYDNTVLNIDTAMEKIAVNFEYDAQAQQLILTLENGEKQYIDMSAIITQYEFEDTDTIAFNVDSDGKVSVSVKNGSITKAMLSSEILSTITTAETNAVASAEAAAQSATNAELDAKMAQSYSVGKSGIRDGEDTDNAKYYCDLAEKHKDSAAMSESNAGISETNAKASESNAATSESNAKISETIAEEKASEAGTSAETATSKANEVAISASVASESEKNAKKSEKLSRSYPIGDADGTRENEDTDNSKYYAAQAEKYAKQAEDIAGGNFIPDSEKGMAGGVAVLNDNLAVEKAVADEDGNNIKDTYATKQQVPDLVKVDNETITKDEDGTLHGAISVDVDSELSETSENPVQNKIIADSIAKINKSIDELNDLLGGSVDVSDIRKKIGYILNPDTEIIKVSDSDINALLNWKTKTAIGTKDGELFELDGYCATEKYIPITPGSYQLKTSSSGTFGIICYDDHDNFIQSWNEEYNVKWISNDGILTIPSDKNITCIRIQVEQATPPESFDIINTKDNNSIFLAENVMDEYGTKFEKVALKNGYFIKTSMIDDNENMHKAEIGRRANCDEGFSIFQLTAPERKPFESTIALMINGDETCQFVDFSCMRYNTNEDGSVEIVCQSRGNTPLPYFSINFNNGKVSKRIEKLRVNPDAIPVIFTSEGLKVRKNNDFTNESTDDDWITFNPITVEQNLKDIVSLKEQLSNMTFSVNDGILSITYDDGQ